MRVKSVGLIWIKLLFFLFDSYKSVIWILLFFVSLLIQFNVRISLLIWILIKFSQIVEKSLNSPLNNAHMNNYKHIKTFYDHLDQHFQISKQEIFDLASEK